MMARRFPHPTLALFVCLGACTTQAEYSRPGAVPQAEWANAPQVQDMQGAADTSVHPAWWTALGDPAIDRLILSALTDNPTLGEAAARVDQARATLGVERARRLPRVDITGSASVARNGIIPAGGNQPAAAGGDATQLSASLGPSLSWELDLWGRIRQTGLAARSRLDARQADAQAARLSITAQIADLVIELRACDYSQAIRDNDIASREIDLSATRARLQFGNIAPFEVASSESNLAAARTSRITQEETCLRTVNALVALSGVSFAEVRLAIPALSGARVESSAFADSAAALPSPQPFRPALPATVLLSHPAVVAAEREAAARWSEIAVARADRLPRIDLAAMLSGQWFRALGSSNTGTNWSLGPSLSAPLFDGGAGRANVGLAEARYREAVSTLDATVRSAARSIEDALAAQESAIARVETSQAAVVAARFTQSANLSRRRLGAIALFELEDSRRQLNGAQDSLIAAVRDRAQTWIELVRLAGPAPDVPIARASSTEDAFPLTARSKALQK